MSADNGVYILECKDQFRVTHLFAIDNVFWSLVEKSPQQEPVPTRVIEMFGKQKYTRNRNTALQIATSILRRLEACEYGINYVHIDRRLGHSKIEITWNTYSHLYPHEEERATEVLNIA